MTLADWRRWQALPPNDRRSILLAMIGLPLVGVGIRWLGFKAMQRRIMGASVACSTDAQGTDRAMVLARWVDAAARRGVYSGTCLSRSMTLLWLLRRERIAGQLRIGVRMVAGQLDAHAWVEVDSQPVNDQPDVSRRYAAYEHTMPFDGRSFR